MSNILPENLKKFIKRQYFMRSAIVAGFMLFLLFASGIFIILPTYFYSENYLERIKETKKNVLDDFDKKEYNSMVKKVKNINEQISKIKEFAEVPSATHVIDEVANIKKDFNNVVEIRSLRITKNKDKKTLLNISGISSDRVTLSKFVQELSNSNMFEEVDLPIKSFVEGEEIPFSIIVSIDDN